MPDEGSAMLRRYQARVNVNLHLFGRWFKPA
jgi:hypothetical protein